MAASNNSSPSTKPTATTTTTKKKNKTKTTPTQTESTHPQSPQNKNSTSTPKRTKSPGVRFHRNRIYDSKNGKTCHQCRQKTMDFSVACTNQGLNKKQCPLNICQKCLLNRYGENAEEAVALGDWICPRCRGICNCSFCMKKRGCGPTGILIHTAKANGYTSVSNLLNMNGSLVTKITEGRKKRRAPDNETNDEPEAKRRLIKAENELLQDEKTMIIEDSDDDEDLEIELPQGTVVTSLEGVDMPSGDIGNALQLSEFCEAFGEVFQLKKGETEILLRELTCANAHKSNETLIVQFHIRLLSLIEENLGKKYSGKSWLEDFKECISESIYPSKENLLEYLSRYDELDFSKRLRLLNFLCDDVLETAKLRLWIEKRNVEEKKKAKERLVANREKEKNMKKKVRDEVAKAILARNGIPLSVSEQKDLVSKINAETAHTLANSLDLRELPRESYVVRSDSVLVDRNGCRLWKLRSHFDKIGFFRQDSCYGDVSTSDEKWFAYNDEEKALVDQCISSSRNKVKK